MILIVILCKENLHVLEFVKPIEDVLRFNKMKYFTKHYTTLDDRDLQRAEKVIICGTSLRDFDYFNHINSFSWIKKFEGWILGICAGMQVLATEKIMGGEIWGSGKNIKERTEIGMTVANFSKEFLGIEKGSREIYSLHQVGVRKVRKYFEVYAVSNKGIQAIKHKKKPFYGVLFHPEVRNKKMVVNFCNL